MDSEAGHHWEPKANAFIQWSKPDAATGVPDFKLRASATDTISWGLNYGNVRWELGGAYTSDVSTNGSLSRRSFSGTAADNLFVSGVIASGLNVYLALERDTTPAGASTNTVTWSPSVLPSFSAAALWDVAYTVSGIKGDFTGIAIGDWVKKATDGQWAYYKVRRLLVDNGTSSGVQVGATGSSASPTIIAGDDGAVANNNVVALELDRSLVPAGTVVQQLFWFRSKYASGDVIVETLAQRNQAIPPYRSTSYYWLGYAYDNAGTFTGRYFSLRNYGTMSPGEEVQSLDDSDQAIDYTAGNSEFAIDFPNNIAYSASTLTGTSFLANIARRLTNNLIPNAGGAANKASINYQIVAGGSLGISVGQELWVNLQDSYSASVITLIAGVVTATANTYEVRSATAAPIRSLTNRNVFCLGRVTTDGYFQFIDGTKVASSGLFDRSPRLINNVLVGGNAVVPLTATNTLTLGSATGVTRLSGGQIIKRRFTNTLSTQLTLADYLISVDTNTIAAVGITTILPNTSTLVAGQVFCIKDSTGKADLYPIDVVGFAGELIDGEAFQSINSNYEQMTVVWTGSYYEIV